MAVLQIIYLVINIIGFAFGLVWFVGPPDNAFISDFFTLIHKYLSNIGLVIVGIFSILLFLPTITLMTSIILFTTLISNYSN